MGLAPSKQVDKERFWSFQMMELEAAGIRPRGIRVNDPEHGAPNRDIPNDELASLKTKKKKSLRFASTTVAFADLPATKPSSDDANNTEKDDNSSDGRMERNGYLRYLFDVNRHDTWLASFAECQSVIDKIEANCRQSVANSNASDENDDDNDQQQQQREDKENEEPRQAAAARPEASSTTMLETAESLRQSVQACAFMLWEDPLLSSAEVSLLVQTQRKSLGQSPLPPNQQPKPAQAAAEDGSLGSFVFDDSFFLKSASSGVGELAFSRRTGDFGDSMGGFGGVGYPATNTTNSAYAPPQVIRKPTEFPFGPEQQDAISVPPLRCPLDHLTEEARRDAVAMVAAAAFEELTSPLVSHYFAIPCLHELVRTSYDFQKLLQYDEGMLAGPFFRTNAVAFVRALTIFVQIHLQPVGLPADIIDGSSSGHHGCHHEPAETEDDDCDPQVEPTSKEDQEEDEEEEQGGADAADDEDEEEDDDLPPKVSAASARVRHQGILRDAIGILAILLRDLRSAKLAPLLRRLPDVLLHESPAGHGLKLSRCQLIDGLVDGDPNIAASLAVVLYESVLLWGTDEDAKALVLDLECYFCPKQEARSNGGKPGASSRCAEDEADDELFGTSANTQRKAFGSRCRAVFLVLYMYTFALVVHRCGWGAKRKANLLHFAPMIQDGIRRMIAFQNEPSKYRPTSEEGDDSVTTANEKFDGGSGKKPKKDDRKTTSFGRFPTRAAVAATLSQWGLHRVSRWLHMAEFHTDAQFSEVIMAVGHQDWFDRVDDLMNGSNARSLEANPTVFDLASLVETAHYCDCDKVQC